MVNVSSADPGKRSRFTTIITKICGQKGPRIVSFYAVIAMKDSREKSDFTPLSVTDSPVIYDRDIIEKRKRKKLLFAVQEILLRAQEKNRLPVAEHIPQGRPGTTSDIPSR